MLHPIFNAARDHHQGDPFAPVELLMYTDLQNPVCARLYPVIKQLRNTMGDALKVVLRHYPAPDKYCLSLEAAIATEIAALYGKFWEMHDIIIESQTTLRRTIFPYFASAIGVEMPLFERAKRGKQVFHKIINDFESGNKSGVDCTPSIFINGKRYNGLLHYASLHKTCRYALTIKDMAV